MMRKWAAAATMGVVVLASTALTGPAWSSSTSPKPTGPYTAPGLTPAVRAAMQAQIPMIALGDSLRATADTASGGFGSLTLDPDHNTVNVYWDGAMPASASQAIDTARKQGITVSVGSSPYTMNQLQAETKRMEKQFMGSAAPKTGAHVVDAVMKNNASGLDVDIAGTPAGLDLVKSSPIPGLVGAVHLELHAVAPHPAQFDTRAAPTPHYNGGQLLVMTSPTSGNMCSSGFGISDGSSANGGAGRRYLITAAHCGWADFYTGNTAVYGSGSSYIGRTSAMNSTDDVQLISTGSDQWVWDGPGIDNEPAQYVKAVSSAGSPFPGEYICSSGAFTGVICGINVDTYAGTGARVASHQMYGAPAAGHGDSGGPVFTSVDGWHTDQALGTVDGCGWYSAYPCQYLHCPAGYWNNSGQRAYSDGCSIELDFIDIYRALKDLGGYQVALTDY